MASTTTTTTAAAAVYGESATPQWNESASKLQQQQRDQPNKEADRAPYPREALAAYDARLRILEADPILQDPEAPLPGRAEASGFSLFLLLGVIFSLGLFTAFTFFREMNLLHTHVYCHGDGGGDDDSSEKTSEACQPLWLAVVQWIMLVAIQLGIIGVTVAYASTRSARGEVAVKRKQEHRATAWRLRSRIAVLRGHMDGARVAISYVVRADSGWYPDIAHLFGQITEVEVDYAHWRASLEPLRPPVPVECDACKVKKALASV